MKMEDRPGKTGFSGRAKCVETLSKVLSALNVTTISLGTSAVRKLLL